MLVLRGGMVLDGTGSAPRAASVVVAGDRIEDVLSADAPPPAGALVEDVSGCLVTPGLVDAHTHLFLAGQIFAEMGYERELLKDSLPLRTLRGAAHARLMLDHGVTTVRDVCTEGAGFADVALRRAIEAGLCEGPRLHPSGPGIGITGGYYPTGWAPGLCLPMGCSIVDSADAARREVRAQIEHGVSWIKVFADWAGSEPVTGDRFVAPTFTREELLAIVDEAARRHRRVAAHVMSDAGARHAIECGVASLEHMGDFSRETLDLAAARGVFLVPTLSVFRHGIAHVTDEKTRVRARQQWERATAVFAEARAAGARIAAGSDIGAYPHAEGSLSELGIYMELGMSPAEAVRAATSEGAALLGTDDGGRIAKGMAADLCVFAGAGDPRGALARLPVLVILAGKVVRGEPPAEPR